MKKAFDQTVRDLKREVNKKVLKVPGIEQKVLDATSNEPWGPHGSHLADIAQATRNFNEYQMIMAVLWKRINDTGKNWRHVYKALTVLEYLVAHGSERVIDEIREHAYQISTLSDFQYIDSSGRDQGSNVRKKSQSLVVLVNDKERIQEVRQKAVANREKYRGASSTGGIYKPSSYSSTGGGYGDRYYDDRNEGRYGNRDEDRNGFGREREWGHRDDDRYSGDGYRDDGQSNDDYGSRSRSTDRERDRAYEDDVQYSSRSGGGRPDDYPQDESRLERKLSGQPTGVPPSYEEAVSDTRSHSQNDRDGGSQAAPAPKAASPPNGSANQASPTVVAGVNAAPVTKEVDAFDEFDPRGSVSAVPPAAASAEMDIFGSIADLADPNALAIMPVTSATTPEPDVHADPNFGTTFVALSSASTVLNQPSEDPFGEIPFRATPSQDPFAAQPQNFGPNVSFPPPSTGEGCQSLQPAAPKVETSPSFDFGDSFQGLTYTPASAQPPQTNQEFSSQGLPATHPSGDILADILPPSGLVTPLAPEVANFLPQPAGLAPLAPQPVGHIPFAPQQLGPAPPAPQPAGIIPFSPQQLGPTTPAPLLVGHFPLGPQLGGPVPLAPQSVGSAPLAPQPAATMPSALLPVASQLLAPQTAAPAPMGLPAQSQPQKDKFEPKSTVWADTLSRGLVNLNISGPKINPLADIGIDFESINRKEKREKEKSSATPATNPITMGKAMGSGSGIGRAGSSGIVPPPNPMMGMGMGGAANMGMGGYAGLMNQPMGMGGYSGGMNQPMGMGMNMGMNGGGSNMGMGAQLRPAGMPPSGPGMPMGYNPMMGMGSYGAQQPYGGYR